MFSKVLIANRGEIACRIIRTCRRLGVRTVAVYSDADARALHVHSADEHVRIGPNPVRDSYLRIDAIVDAARSAGVDAIHPGYGLLSENGDFARAVVEAGIVFIGPSPSVLDALGDKVRAREVAERCGVPAVPGSPLAADSQAIGWGAAVTETVAQIGYPCIVKATGGGGGIGMQIVRDEAGLARAIRSCSDRAKTAFGDARVYVERYLEAPRHIEVQVLCDAHGGAVALGERECSLQRRHQKIIEESPSCAPMFSGGGGELRRAELAASACRILQSVGYVGAGTCEFLATESGDIYFLEVNARLQVEHPVTEMCTGLDLVEQQLLVASGAPIAPGVVSTSPSGVAIEARIYAEDPARGFLPQPGRITSLVWPNLRESPGDNTEIRIESGVAEGDEITPYYDPLIAKVIAHADNRMGAVAALRRALDEMKVEVEGVKGPARTNLEFLRTLLADARVEEGRTHTHFVEQFMAQVSGQGAC